ncbi:MAG: hypothetical protein JWM74_4820 [Myxococcaceae bacterium]|nr:hypothetical protein [Myxococcaceae bacterium]
MIKIMKMRAVVCLSLASSAFACSLVGLAACDGDDTTIAIDASADDAFASDVTTSPDVATQKDAGGGDALEGTPPWMLVNINYASKSDMVAFSIPGKKVDGRLTYNGFIGTTTGQGGGLYLMEQQADIVVKLSSAAPWKGGPSWTVRLDDAYDGGKSYADPVAVVQGPSDKAYVLRFNRNKIAVLDTTQNLDAGAPLKTIDLASQLDPLDLDGHVDMAAGVYVASKQRLYVVLGNFDLTKTPAIQTDPFTPCQTAKPKVVTIDTSTDTVVGSPILLDGYNPLFGGMIYDGDRDRLLVVNAGCNVDLPLDAGKGPLLRREVDEVVLGTGATARVLDLVTKGYPSGLAVLDAKNVALGFDFGFEARTWDVTTAALGAQIPNAPDTFVYDGKGNLLGTKTEYFADGGSASSIVSVRVDDGGLTTLGTVPFTDTGYLGGVDYVERK